MKYNVGDLIVETCFKYTRDYRKGYITDIEEHYNSGYVVIIKWFDIEQEDVYHSDQIDAWIKRNNAKYYSVDK